MASCDFNLGGTVYCKDGNCGRLLKLVTDLHTKQVTDLSVQTGLFMKTNRVVPVSIVEKAASQGVYLVIMRKRLDRLPEYYEDEYLVPAQGGMTDAQYGQELMWVAGHFCLVH